jgi:hypothetical protein
MRTLYKLWVALSITAFAAMALTPMLASADAFGVVQVQNGNTSPQVQNGNYNPQVQNGNSVGGLSNPLGQVTGICQLLKIVLNIALLLGVPIAMFFIVFAGFKLVLARGNPEELKRARLNLVWTLAGIAIFIGVWTFVTILANTLGALGVQILGDCR